MKMTFSLFFITLGVILLRNNPIIAFTISPTFHSRNHVTIVTERTTGVLVRHHQRKSGRYSDTSINTNRRRDHKPYHYDQSFLQVKSTSSSSSRSSNSVISQSNQKKSTKRRRNNNYKKVHVSLYEYFPQEEQETTETSIIEQNQNDDSVLIVVHAEALDTRSSINMNRNSPTLENNNQLETKQCQGYMKQRTTNVKKQKCLIQHEAFISTTPQSLGNHNDLEEEEEFIQSTTWNAVLLHLYRRHLLLKQQYMEEAKPITTTTENGKSDNDKIDFQFTLQIKQESTRTSGTSSSTDKSSSLPYYLIPIHMHNDNIRNNADDNNDNDCKDDDDNDLKHQHFHYYQIDKFQFIQYLHEYSYNQRGTEQSQIALDILGLLSRERNTFSFDQYELYYDNDVTQQQQQDQQQQKQKQQGRNVISYQKQIIPNDTIQKVMNIMNIIKSNQWLSTNPDSVDGLPSLHLNLISGGKPLFRNNVNDDDSAGSDGSDDPDDQSFDDVVSNLTSILKPIVYDRLLPIVQEQCGSNTIEISDVFLRYYGNDIPILQSDDEGSSDGSNDDASSSSSPSTNLNNGRFGLSPHYDVFSSATSVIALDATAASGQNGLYTIYAGRNHYHQTHNDKDILSCATNDDAPRSSTTTTTTETSCNTYVSSHAGLRQFFPLNTGDGVIHTFDILHGVDVDPTLDCSRTSLIIWFVDKQQQRQQDQRRNISGSSENESSTYSSPSSSTTQRKIITDQPWLLEPDTDDHLKQFVLALASDCKAEIVQEEEEEKNDDIITTSNNSSNSNSSNSNNAIHELYIQSARQGNAFALNSLAEICIDGLLSKNQFEQTNAIPLDLNGLNDNPFLSHDHDDHDDEINVQVSLARALWFESSMRGNRVAQASLGDSIMEEFMINQMEAKRDVDCTINYNNDNDNDIDDDDIDDQLLIATTFFCMSAQQGYEVAKDALGRILQIEYSRKSVMFANSNSDDENDNDNKTVQL